MSKYRPLRRKPYRYKKYDYEFRDYPVMDLEAEYLDLWRRITQNDIRPTVFRAFDLFYETYVGLAIVLGEGPVEAYTDPDSFGTSTVSVLELPDPYLCIPTVLLIPFDGVNAATTSWDYSNSAHSLNYQGTIFDLATATKKFGTASGRGQLSSGWIEVPDHDDWYFPGEFTIEAWIRPDFTTATTKTILWNGAADGDQAWGLSYEYLTATTKRFKFDFFPTGLVAGGTTVYQTAENVDQSVFHHVAVTRDASNIIRLFVDGIVKATSAAVSGGYNPTTALNIAGKTGGTVTWNGYIDDLRITKGAARYTANYSVPTSASPLCFTAASGTVLNPFDRSKSLTLSNGFLTVRRDGPADFVTRTLRATTGRSTGKWMFAFDPVTVVGNTTQVGLATAALGLTSSTYNSPEALCQSMISTGDIWDGNTSQAFGGRDCTGASEAQLAIDFDIGKWWVRADSGPWMQNGNPMAGTGGRVVGSNLTGDTLYPALSSPSVGNIYTFNFGATPFANGIPTGFTSWDGSQTGTSADPYYSGVMLLVHFDGADGAVTATDKAFHTLTVSGNAQLDTAAKKFGTASLLCDGTNDWFTTATGTNGDFTFPGEFTIEAWVRPNSAGVASISFMGQGNSSAGTLNWRIGFNCADAGGTQRKFLFTYWADSTTATTLNGTVSAIDISVFHHVAATRDASNIIRLFVDGVLEATSAATPGNGAGSSIGLYIGAGNAGLQGWNGWIDEPRITKGFCRYTANFTPPTAAFPDP